MGRAGGSDRRSELPRGVDHELDGVGEVAAGRVPLRRGSVHVRRRHQRRLRLRDPAHAPRMADGDHADAHRTVGQRLDDAVLGVDRMTGELLDRALHDPDRHVHRG